MCGWTAAEGHEIGGVAGVGVVWLWVWLADSFHYPYSNGGLSKSVPGHTDRQALTRAIRDS